MTLIKCPDCGKMVSDRAQRCHDCGFPIQEEVQRISEITNTGAENINYSEYSNLHERDIVKLLSKSIKGRKYSDINVFQCILKHMFYGGSETLAKMYVR